MIDYTYHYNQHGINLFQLLICDGLGVVCIIEGFAIQRINMGFQQCQSQTLKKFCKL